MPAGGLSAAPTTPLLKEPPPLMGPAAASNEWLNYYIKSTYAKGQISDHKRTCYAYYWGPGRRRLNGTRGAGERSFSWSYFFKRQLLQHLLASLDVHYLYRRVNHTSRGMYHAAITSSNLDR